MPNTYRWFRIVDEVKENENGGEKMEFELMV
jgi:hypothetical protein